MNITKEKIKEVILKKGYKWYDDKPHIISIRTNLQIPDLFNDPIFIIYKNVILSAICTTEPGVTYQKKLLNPKGCWVMMPAQMEDAYALGYHQGKADHKCLRSVGKIFGLREDDKDGILLNDKDAVSTWVDGTTVGANIHGAIKKLITKIVGPWSAGCQVINDWEKKEEFINFLCEWEKKNKSLWKGIFSWIFGKSGIRYTYTLLEERDFQ